MGRIKSLSELKELMACSPTPEEIDEFAEGVRMERDRLNEILVACKELGNETRSSGK